MKKLDGGLKKTKIIFIILYIFFAFKSANPSQILDYETELFIKSIIESIKISNKIDKEINFKIISSEDINAYVNKENIIHITSGLIINCKDYVALVSVIAHEIGHIHNNHIKQRLLNIDKLENFNTVSSLSIIAGSMIANNPDLLQGLAVSSAGLSEIIITFSKDQEREADLYSLKTLSKLNLYSSSIIELLKTIEKKAEEKGYSRDEMKLSTHPYFEERIELINYLNSGKSNNINYDTNYNFNYIQAKYIGYSGDASKIDELDEPFKAYAKSILEAKIGNLKESMIGLNKLVLNNSDNIYVFETKADILFSYGYINESIKFYNKVLKKLPDNYYAQIRIFENKNIGKLTFYKANKLFLDNLNLLEIFYNNRNILYKYLELSLKLNKIEWIEFLDYWLNKKNNNKEIRKKLTYFMETKDQNLLDLIKKINSKI